MATITQEFSALIQEFRVLPSANPNYAIDAYWKVEVPHTSTPFVPKYQLEAAERNTGPWSKVFSSPISETQALNVMVKNWSHGPGRFVRLVVIGPNRKRITVSAPFEPGHAMSRREYLEYRYFLYLENIHLTKAAGFSALYAPKIIMECPCPECADEILGGAPDANCRVCFGTGVKGGYHPVIQVRADWSEPPKGKGNVAETQMGPVEVEQKFVRIMPFPVARTKDVFIDPIVGTRYAVLGVQLINYKVWTIAQVLALSLLPKTDPAYKIPTPEIVPVTR